VLAGPGHQREEHGGADGDRGASDVLKYFHATECRAVNPSDRERRLKRS
jgi:hypothetical protein